MGQAQRQGLEERLSNNPPPEGGYTDERVANAVKKEIADEYTKKYGGIENIKQSIAEHPVQTAADASLVFGGAGKALRAVPMMERAANVVSATGKVLDPMTAATLATQGAGKTIAAGAGVLSGSGMKPIEEAAKAGFAGGAMQRAFRDSLTGKTTPDEIVESANNAVQNIVKNKNLDYNTKKKVIMQGNQQMSWTDVGKNLPNDIHEIHGEDLLGPRGQAARRRMDETLLDWARKGSTDPWYTSAEGFDALKKKFTKMREEYTGRPGDPETPEFQMADSYRKAISGVLKDKVPDYADLMEGYSEAKQQINELRKTLSLNPGKNTIDQTLRKLTSSQRKNVNTNFGQRDRLITQLEENGAQTLRPQLAGQALQSWEPHGLARVGAQLLTLNHPGGEWLAAGFSPRVMGNLANRAGQIAAPLKYIPRGSPQAAAALGRWGVGEKRGGKVDRAMRVVKRH